MQYIIKLVDGAPTGNPITMSNAVQAGIVTLSETENHVYSTDLENSGYALFKLTERPTSTDPLKEYQSVTPTETDEEGAWLQRFELGNREFASEADRETDINNALMLKQHQIRTKRNALLLQSDLTQLPDTPFNTSLWASYREELRDITTQESFSTGSVTWPTAPDNLDVD